MKRLRIIALFVGLGLSCQQNELAGLPENTDIVTETVTLTAGQVFNYTIATAIPVEGETRISQQAANFALSKITTASPGLVYQYQPVPGFLGTDFVEITHTYGNGGGVAGRVVIKIFISVVPG